jgi:transcriptional regulator with XRE-family HTH domain
MTGTIPQTINFSVALRRAIRFAGCRQGDFARRLGLEPSAFSMKLNGSKYILTVPEIKRAILILAELEAINRKEEVLYLLKLAGLRSCAFSDQDWQTKPLNQLE